MSKYFELVDTVFIVLRKRKLYFLHYIHHITALLYMWDAWCWESPAGIYYATMNYAVHAIMYSYYALAMVGTVPSWGKYVTVLQILQMVGGTMIGVYSLYLSIAYPWTGRYSTNLPLRAIELSEFTASGAGCSLNTSNCFFSILMYVMFLYLFCKFFYDRFIMKAPERSFINESIGSKVATVILRRFSVQSAFPDIADKQNMYISRRVGRNTLANLEDADTVRVGDSILTIEKIIKDHEASMNTEADLIKRDSTSTSASFGANGNDTPKKKLVSVRLDKRVSWVGDSYQEEDHSGACDKKLN